MVCDISTEHEEPLSELIKRLYEFEGIEVLCECVKLLQESVTREELEKLSDDELYRYYLQAQENIK
ncbi:hypothetical protein [Methanosphaera sp. WGK6]|uniref:hypothetical protein n=1 Tax=Methanosphaera sp. WGK6 TaxID=1561964 RepID=UPI00084BF1E4|nr:hypothetical protein [Methanosphaera sp. WGK6]OED30396.1 hypothetical protein NL43_03255 [Methanosphaera sp. WGK6]